MRFLAILFAAGAMAQVPIHQGGGAGGASTGLPTGCSSPGVGQITCGGTVTVGRLVAGDGKLLGTSDGCTADASVATPAAGKMAYYQSCEWGGIAIKYDDGRVELVKPQRIAVAVFDGGPNALSGTYDACEPVAAATTIGRITMLADASGSATVDVRTVSFAAYTGPASATSIAAAAIPALSGAVKYQDAILAGWSTAIAANSVVCFHVTNPATIKWIMVQLEAK